MRHWPIETLWDPDVSSQFASFLIEWGIDRLKQIEEVLIISKRVISNWMRHISISDIRFQIWIVVRNFFEQRTTMNWQRKRMRHWPIETFEGDTQPDYQRLFLIEWGILTDWNSYFSNVPLRMASIFLIEWGNGRLKLNLFLMRGCKCIHF